MSSEAHVADHALTCERLEKSYAGDPVLKGVSFTLTAGEVVGLIGENGAGKSTLSSIIAGIVAPTGGSMTLDGQPYQPSSPHDALDQGVALIHPEIRLVPSLSVAENIFLGRLLIKGGRVDTASMVRQSREVLDLLGINIDPRRPVAGLSMAAQQSIEIAKAISRRPKYVIFDEPSASLTGHETDRVLDQIRRIKEHGVGVIYISHRLEEVRDVCSQIICLRDGNLVKSWTTGDVPQSEMVSAMVGSDFQFEHHAPDPHLDEIVLEVRNLGRKGAFSDINFTVSRGEILGIAGLVGAVRTELVRTIAGVDRYDTGEIKVEGRPVTLHSPAAAVNEGIVVVSEDRKGQGLNLGLSSAVNILQPWEKSLGRGQLITNRLLNRTAAKSRADFDIRGLTDLPVLRPSGGNQQKVLMAKWLVREPKVLILDEPTRGVDVGARMAIYEVVRNCAARGVAVIVVSSELNEVLGLSHRVLVMSAGRQREILPRSEVTSEAVMELASRSVSNDQPPAADARR